MGLPINIEELLNGSPRPLFQTDKDCSYFLVTLYCRKDMVGLISPEPEAPEPTEVNIPSGVNKGLNPVNNCDQMTALLSEDLRRLVQEVQKRSKPEKTRIVILRLCALEDLSVSALARIPGKGEKYLRNSFLKPMMQEGWITYTIPDNPSHPGQAYRTTDRGKEIAYQYDLYMAL